MVDIHNIIDGFFVNLGNTGSVSNGNLVKMMTLSLIDDYGHEMIECNPSYKKVLQDIVSKIEGSSCLFKIGMWNDDLYDIDSEQQTIAIPAQYISNVDNGNDMSSITRIDIDNLVR